MTQRIEVLRFESSVDDDWDRFVDGHPYGLLCHTSAWRRALERSFEHIEARFLVLRGDTGASIRAALPLFRVRSRLTGRRLVSIPFATLCDPLVRSREELRALLDAALALSAGERCAYVRVRTFRAGPLFDPCRMARTDDNLCHQLMLDQPPDRLMSCFHRSCVRQPIRRALNSGLRAVEVETPDQFRACFSLYLNTRRRLGLPVQPLRFFRHLWAELAPVGGFQLLMAEYDQRPVSCLLLFRYKDRVSAEFEAYDDAYIPLSPNHFLFWHAIRSACENGYRVFDFGRTSAANEGLLAFKRRWGTEEAPLSEFFAPAEAASKPGSWPATWEYRLAQTVIRHCPAAAARSLGGFCYHHLG